MNGLTPGPVPSREPDGLHVAGRALARVRAAAGPSGLLAEAFDAFEVVRTLARGCEAQHPELLMTFMTVADAAVDGREALTVAPTLPAGPSRVATGAVSPGAAEPGPAGPDEVADLLSKLGTLLAERLTSAAATATLPGDQAACLEAAQAAQRISQLMARDGDGRDLR